MRRRKFLQTTIAFLSFGLLKNSRASAVYSATKKFFVNKIKFIWSGSITANSVRVNAKLTNSTAAARLVVSTNAGLSNPVYGSFSTANVNNNYVARLSVTGLSPNTEYFYGIEADGQVDTAIDAIGKFKTTSNSPHSFKFSVASCNSDGNHPVFHRIREKSPFLHITHGDFHYGNPNSATDVNVHRAPFELELAKPTMKEFLRNVPIAYTWDDHDYCGDNTNGFASGRTNARLVYQEYVPHYPLAAGTGDVPIYQAFTIGRVRFIITDLRSERGVGGPTVMGAPQKAWFKNECLSAKNADQIIVWVSSVPWGSTIDTDTWAGYTAERTELSDYFKANNIRNLLIVCGDAHMLGIDNGFNNDFSTGANNPFKYPVLQAAAVNQIGSYKGGTFSEGYFINPSADVGQYAVVDITDNASQQVNISITGYRVSNTGVESVLVNYAFSFTMANTVLPIKISDFTVQKHQGSKALLSWKTSIPLALGCEKMIVERGNNGTHFNELHTIHCNSSTNIVDHSFVDASPLNNTNYYRIKLIEQNGNIIYSPIKFLTLQKEISIVVLKNPVKDELILSIHAVNPAAPPYSILDSSGRVMLKGRLNLNNGANTINIRLHNLARGLYFFGVLEKQSMIMEKFVVA